MNVCFVIVTFNPSEEVLKNVIFSVKQQVKHIIVVDNGSENIEKWHRVVVGTNIKLIKLEKNAGIATASNIGAKYAKMLGSDFVVFSDQDTIFPADFCNKLDTAQIEKSHSILVPQFFDITKGEMAPFQDHRNPQRNILVNGDSTRVLHAIASGMYINVDIFLELGGFDENLFIDWVDFEFCWRAAKRNVFTYCIPELVIMHKLGDSVTGFFGRNITLRSCARHYFMIRNELYLSIFGKHTPAKLRLWMFFRSLRRALLMPFFARNQNFDFFVASIKAVRDALMQKQGPLT